LSNQTDTPSTQDEQNVPAVEPSSNQVVEASEVVGENETSGEKTYTQAEVEALLSEKDTSWKARYGGLDAKLTETIEEARQLRTQVAENAEKIARAQEDALIKRTEEEGGDVGLVKTIVERDRASRAEANRLAELKAELESQSAIVSEAARTKKANDLVTKYGLNSDILKELLAANTPEQMEILALKAYADKQAIDAKPVTNVDGGPPKGTGVDISKLSLEERAGLALDGKI